MVPEWFLVLLEGGFGMLSMRHFCGQHTLLLVVTHCLLWRWQPAPSMRCLSPEESAEGEEVAAVLVRLGGGSMLKQAFQYFCTHFRYQILALIYRMDFDDEL